ncbi:MAG: transcription elongation factor GreA [Halobacteriovoraceae bacterium]|nr:transcription elongation factor GreA [Halobacteriovoraceae bacterium]|tara:strand:- start:943 stop:1422 length:480 start_codon:yes stop_codon:yes gene_type:complete
MDFKEPITIKGKEKIDQELEQLIKVDREDIKQKIQEARELGDLKENAEYHSAKEKQALIEGRIGYLQGIVSNCNVIDPKEVSEKSKIVFGATVTLYDESKESEVKYMIVGHEESDNREGKISYKSPLGKALIGKEEGDSVVVQAPKGELEYEVVSIEYK